MSKVIVPKGYKATLGLYDTQTAIGMLKRIFEERLCNVLNLKRVSAPLFVLRCADCARTYGLRRLPHKLAVHFSADLSALRAPKDGLYLQTAQIAV